LQVLGRIQVAWPAQINSNLFANGSRALTQDYDPIRELHGFLNIMRHEQYSLLLFLPDSSQISPHFDSGNKVECTKWLIHINDLGIWSQRPSNLNALTHSPGQFPGVSSFEASQSNHLNVVMHNFSPFIARTATEPKSDVLFDGEPWKNPIVLKYEDPFGIRTGDGSTLNQNLTPGLPYEAGNDIEQSCLSTPGRTDDTNKFSSPDIQIH
jgi:hypothetical protein